MQTSSRIRSEVTSILHGQVYIPVKSDSFQQRLQQESLLTNACDPFNNAHVSACVQNVPSDANRELGLRGNIVKPLYCEHRWLQTKSVRSTGRL